MHPSPIEKPTLIERFVSVIPLPYNLSALVWSLVLAGPVFYLLQELLGSAPALGPSLEISFVLNTTFPLYTFLMVRYVRLRVVRAEAPMSKRLEKGEEDYGEAFGNVTRTAPVLVMTAALSLFLLVLYRIAGLLDNTLVLIINVVVVFVNTLAFSTYIWEYATTNTGVHKIGGRVKLESFLENRMMGVRQLGSLAVLCSTAYYGGLLLAYTLLSFVLSSRELPQLSSWASLVLFSVLLILGVPLFFVPLNRIHARMQAEKRKLLLELASRYPRVENSPAGVPGTATLEDIRAGLSKISELQELDLLERKVLSLPTWPFDIQLIGRLITIILSVTAAIIARILIDYSKV